jgi:hypothetical protein
MSRAPARFKQSDVTRALRAARAAGLEVSGYEVDPVSGRITITTSNSDGAEQKPGTDLDKWMARRAG